MLRCAARFPDALVGLAPHLGRALGLRLDDRPQATRQPVEWRVCRRIESSTAPNTSFWRWSNAPLPIRTGRAPRVTGEIVARRLGEIAPSVDAVHDLQRPVLGRLDVGDELHELVGFPVERQEVQRLERERRVAHPGVAVVPVAFAARRLGQRRRERGDGGARSACR